MAPRTSLTMKRHHPVWRSAGERGASAPPTPKGHDQGTWCRRGPPPHDGRPSGRHDNTHTCEDREAARNGRTTRSDGGARTRRLMTGPQQAAAAQEHCRASAGATVPHGVARPPVRWFRAWLEKRSTKPARRGGELLWFGCRAGIMNGIQRCATRQPPTGAECVEWQHR